MKKRVVKPKEAAEYLNCHYDTLRKLDRTGILIAHRSPSNRRYYFMDQLNIFLEKKTKRKKEPTIKIPLDDALFRAVKKRAFSQEISMAEFVRQLLRKTLFAPSFSDHDSRNTTNDKTIQLLNSLTKKVTTLSNLSDRLSGIENILSDFIDSSDTGDHDLDDDDIDIINESDQKQKEAPKQMKDTSRDNRTLEELKRDRRKLKEKLFGPS